MSRSHRKRHEPLEALDPVPSFATFDAPDSPDDDRIATKDESDMDGEMEAMLHRTIRGVLEADEEEARIREGRLQGLIDALLDHLGMGHWQVRGKFHPVNDEFRAHIRIDRYFRQATIYLGEDEPEESWDLAVCHELIHLILDPLSHFAENCITHVDSHREAELLSGQVVGIEEPLVNRLTQIIIGRPWPQSPSQEID